MPPSGFLCFHNSLLPTASGRSSSFGPRHREPEGCVRAAAPGLEGGDAVVERFFLDVGCREDAQRACSQQDLFQVFRNVRKVGRPGAASEEDPGITNRRCTGRMEETDQSAAHVGVVPQSVIGTNIGLPQRHEPREAPAKGEARRDCRRTGRSGLRSGPPGPSLGPRTVGREHARGETACARGRTCPTPRRRSGKVEGVTRSELDDIGFSVVVGLSPRLGKLVGVALDSQDRRAACPATLAMARVNWASPLPTSRILRPQEGSTRAMMPG